MMDNLPKGWTKEKLPQVAKVIMGQSPPSSTYNTGRDGLPFFQGKAEFGKLYPSVIKYCNSPKKIAEVGDVLISVRAPVGPTNLCKEKSCIGRGLSAFRPNQVTTTKYLLYYMRNIESWLSSQGTGSTFTAISKTDLENIEILLPPLNEQRLIVAKLEKLLQKVDACKERLDKIPTILKRFRQSILAAACSGSLTEDWREKNPEPEPVTKILNCINDKGIIDDSANSYDLYKLPKNWSWLRIIDIGNVKGGKRLPKGEKLVKKNTGYPYIKAGFLKEGTVVTDNLEYLTPEVREKIKRYTVNDGDVYITIVGACIGDAGVIPKKLDGANLTENAAKICNTEGVNNHYLANWLRSTVCQDFIKRTILSAAQGKLALGRIKMLPVPIPPSNEQQEIVRRVEALFKITDQIEERYNKARAYVDKLTRSILAKAFRGELVPQDPNDEPASELLQRIKARLAKNKAKKKTSRMTK